MKDKKVLVTGVTGRIGSFLARELARDNETWGLARFSNADRKKEVEEAGVKTIAKDLGDSTPALLDGVPDDFDYIFHEGVAWKISPEMPWQKVYEINCFSTGRLMQHQKRLKAFVYGSTGGVYPAGQEWLTEDLEPEPQAKIYTLSKWCGENTIGMAARLLNVPTVILRYCWPCSDRSGVIRPLILTQMRGESREYFKNDMFSYNPIFMPDIVRLTIKSVEVAAVPPEVINIAGREKMSLKGLIEKAAGMLGKEPKCHELDDERQPWLADPTKMEKLLGKAEISLEEGMRSMVEYTLKEKGGK